MTVSASDLKMGKGQSKVYVAKESFKPPTDDGTTCGYIAFEARWMVTVSIPLLDNVDDLMCFCRLEKS